MTDTKEVDVEELRDALEFAWAIICNAGGSDWTRESAEWQQAAARFRRQYFALLPTVSDVAAIDGLLAETVPLPPPPAKRTRLTRWLKSIFASSANPEKP